MPQTVPVGFTPTCTLVGENVWLVIVEDKDQVAVGKLWQPHQVSNIGVVRARDQNGMLWRVAAYLGNNPLLDACPAKHVAEFRLVENLEKGALRIKRGIIRGDVPPQNSELLDCIVVGRQSFLVLRARMHIEDDGQPQR